MRCEASLPRFPGSKVNLTALQSPGLPRLPRLPRRLRASWSSCIVSSAGNDTSLTATRVRKRMLGGKGERARAVVSPTTAKPVELKTYPTSGRLHLGRGEQSLMNDPMSPDRPLADRHQQSYSAAPLDDERDVCRVCRSGAPEDGELFWPCQCSGSMRVCVSLVSLQASPDFRPTLAVRARSLSERLDQSERNRRCSEMRVVPYAFVIHSRCVLWPFPRELS